MLSMDYELSVPGFKTKEIGHQSLVRAHNANLKIRLTNDGQTNLRKLKVEPVVESYIGQDRPMLFLSLDEQTIDEIPPKSMISLTFRIWVNYPGLVAVAVHITDANNNAVMAKRESETTYQEQPVRWWFHVVDNVSVEILKTLRTLVAQKQKDSEKPKTKSPKGVKK